jgi:DNA invertase Pin-like site-specific DNA recombinase
MREILMSSPAPTPKITREHTRRLAIVYVRQSSAIQVLNHTASTARQYNLAELARRYGWPADRVVVIDQDQGLSGAYSDNREGFKRLLADTCLGNVGAIFCLEASRLARDSADWQQLVKICIVTDTLIIDEQGVHGPRSFDDKLLLDVKGLFSEIERHVIRARLCGGRLERARQGKLRTSLPPGYVYSASGDIVLDPDEEVQGLVRLLFERFTSLGTALAVVRYFNRHKIPFPTRYYDGAFHREFRREPLYYGHVIYLLHNPVYAGMYVYGRRTTRTEAALDGDVVRLKARPVHVPRADWVVVIRDSHEKYITEEQYEENQRRLAENLCSKKPGSVGAARCGSALLQGIARCGVCGNKLSVSYRGREGEPQYRCRAELKLCREEKCVYAPAARVDPAVARCFLEAVAPAHSEVSLAVLDQLEAESRQDLERGRARVRQAELQAERAERLYRQAAEENGRVRSELGGDWEAALGGVEAARKELEALRASSRQSIGPEDREALLRQMRDLPTLWDAPATSNQERKELLRLLIKDVVLLRCRGCVKVTIRWQTGARHEVEAPWPSRPESHRTDPEILDIIRRLAPTHSYNEIAEHLNRNGYRSQRGKSFTRTLLIGLRRCWGIVKGGTRRPCRSDDRGEDGRYKVAAAARLLGVSYSCVDHLCRNGRVDFIRLAVGGKRWVKLTDEDVERLKREIRPRKRWSARRLKRPQPE